MKNEMKSSILRISASIAGFSLLLLRASALQAQGCALCYQSAAASGTHFIQALKDGILILLFPPIFISAGIAVMAYRKRNQCSPVWKSGNKTSAIGQRGADQKRLYV
jgi:hypothetical protein